MLAIPGAAQSGKPEAAPAWVGALWEQLIGTWVADNSAFKNEQDTMDAYGIDWAWGLGKKSLTGRLYGLKGGKEVATFWEFREYWHPLEKRLITQQHSATGVFGVGPHHRKPDGSTEMLQTFFNPVAGTVTREGHRAWLEGDVHTTTSFSVDDKGVWTERRTYVWKRKAGK